MGLPVPDAQAPDARRVARFAADLAALWPKFRDDAELRLALAVSGGPDSTALLLLAAAAFPGRVEAATVDHRLRSEAAQEARAVAALCDRLDVPHAILAVDVAPGNVQAEARAARYAALAGWMEGRGLPALATAHHADDQAETLLARLNRGSGVAGLAGARAVGRVPETRLGLLRPLLGWRRADLVGVVAAAGVEAADDPSNSDDRFDRVRLRKALAGADWIDVAAVAASAGHLSDADAALDWAAQREWRERVRDAAMGKVWKPSAPRAVALRVLARIVREMDDSEPRGGAVARVYDSLMAGRPAPIGELIVRAVPEGWSFSHAPKRRNKPDISE